MSNLPFGIDISSYQYSADGKRKPDFDKLNATVSFCAIRAGISWGYVDKWFRYSWDNVSVPKIAYHVQYPGEDANRQMDHLLRIIPVGEHTRYCLDLELAHGQSKARITQCTLTMLERLRRETGLYPILYSRASWVNQYLSVDDLPEVDWWLANYLRARPAPYFTPEKEPPPILPRGVDRWLIHQTGEKGDGSAVGVVSHYVDTNRWNGSEAELRAYFGLGEETPEPEPEPPVDPPTDPEPDPPTQPKAYKATVTANVLNVRKAPQDIVVGSLKRGAEVEVLDEQDAWRKLGHQLWVSGEWLKRIANAPDPQPQPDLVPYVLWGQRDARWASDRMGVSNITLGQQGCLVTAVASVMASYGIDTDPKRYNGRLSSEGGYLAPNLMYWQMPRIFWGVKLTEYELFAGGTGWQRSVDTILSSRRPVLAMVDMIPGGAFNQHWVTIVGKRGNDYIITDPWTADLVPLTRYENKIYRLAGYSRD